MTTTQEKTSDTSDQISETGKRDMTFESPDAFEGHVFDHDINIMHRKFGFHKAVRDLDAKTLREFLKFRFKFLQEEIDEGLRAIDEGNPDDCVDSLIDLSVVAIGTLDLFEVAIADSWWRVHSANMSKVAGSNPSRPNAFGLPDLVKPPDFISPSHTGNTGLFDKALKN